MLNRISFIVHSFLTTTLRVDVAIFHHCPGSQERCTGSWEGLCNSSYPPGVSNPPSSQRGEPLGVMGRVEYVSHMATVKAEAIICWMIIGQQHSWLLRLGCLPWTARGRMTSVATPHRQYSSLEWEPEAPWHWESTQPPGASRWCSCWLVEAGALCVSTWTM